MDNRNFLVRRWYGPVAEALASSYPNIYFNFPDSYSFIACSSDLADLLDRKGWESYQARIAEIRVFAEFSKRAYTSFIEHPYEDTEQGCADSDGYLLHRGRETGEKIDRESIYKDQGGRCDRCGTDLDLRFFQAHETNKGCPRVGRPGKYVPLCGDCHSLMEGHGGPLARAYGRPLYRSKSGKIHKEKYAHLQKQRVITQVWPDLQRRWESPEDRQIYSERELAVMRQINVGIPCKVCLGSPANNLPDTRSDVEQYASAIADQYIGHRRFDQPVTGATLLPAEGCYVAVCGGVGNGDYGLPNHRSNLHRS